MRSNVLVQKILSRVILMAVVLTVAAIPVVAQVTGATLSGRITDGSGAIIPQTRVQIQNLATKVLTVVTANADGFYTAPNLLPAAYQVSFSREGFRTRVENGVELEVGAQRVLDVALQIGVATETVQVTSTPPGVELGSSSVAYQVDERTIRELPLNGRSYTDLATLTAGVSQISTQQPMANNASNRANRGFGIQLTINGGRPGMNNYRVDGISIQNYDNSGPGSVLGTNLGVDAIQEFSVITTNYSAEYGKTSAGVINAVTRSGTNDFHGNVYEFIRNNKLDTPGYFDLKGVPPYRRNQFGGSVGGPILKSRAFFFADYEGIRQFQGVSFLNIVPSLAARAGKLCSAPSSTSCTPSTVTVDPSVAQYLPGIPLPNGAAVAGMNGDAAYNTFVQSQVAHENYLKVRVDNKISDKDSFFGSYNYDKTPFTAPDSFGNVSNLNQTYRQVYTIEETHAFSSSLVNTGRFGFDREISIGNQSIQALNPWAARTDIGILSGYYPSGVTISGGYTGLAGGIGATTGFHYAWNTFQFADDALLVRGTHSIKFGGSVERDQMNGTRLSGGPGAFVFSSLSNFLTNKPASFANQAPPYLGESFRQGIYGLYIQDDWRARKNLTLNLGLRYETVTNLRASNNRLAVLRDPTAAAPEIGTALFLANPTLKDFSPRVGLTWDPYGNGKTAVRAGFGVFDILPLYYQVNTVVYGLYPFALRAALTAPPAGSFYGGAAALFKNAAYTAFYTTPTPKRSYVMQWQANIQQELMPHLVMEVGYVGTRASHQARKVDSINQVQPYQTSAGYVFPYKNSPAVLNPAYGAVQGQFYNGNTIYHALNLQVTKEASHGFQFRGALNWSKTIDDGSAVSIGDQFTNAVPTQPTYFDLSTVRGLADFNVGRSFIFNGIWTLPIATKAAGLVHAVASGWQVATILNVHDGAPFTPTFGKGSQVLGSKSSDPYAFPNRIRGTAGCDTAINRHNVRNYINTSCFTVPTAPSLEFYNANCDPSKGTYPQCYNLVGNASRNSLIGPGFLNLDSSLVKNNSFELFRRSFTTQFRIEAFNILNHPNFGIPSTSKGGADVFSSTGVVQATAGQLLSTAGSSRQMQFGLKIGF